MRLPIALKPATDFAIHTAVGGILFLFVLGVATTISIAIHFFQGIDGFPDWLGAAAFWMEWCIFWLDVACFGLFLLVEAGKFMREVILSWSASQ